jgi:hypothetical protein
MPVYPGALRFARHTGIVIKVPGDKLDRMGRPSLPTMISLDSRTRGGDVITRWSCVRQSSTRKLAVRLRSPELDQRHGRISSSEEMSTGGTENVRLP